MLIIAKHCCLFSILQHTCRRFPLNRPLDVSLTVIRDDNEPSKFRELLLGVLFLLMSEEFSPLQHLNEVMSLWPRQL